MRPKIYYFGTYDTISKYKRRCTTPAIVKMDYILFAINQAGFDVELISSSYIVEKKWCFDKGGKKKLNDYTLLNLSPSFGYKTFFGKYLSIIFTIICFFFKLLKIKKQDILIAYHGVWYSTPILLAKKIKKFQLIVEVEEIYTHAFKRPIKGLKKELKFIKSADKYICVNDLICDFLNIDKDKSIVCYGSYIINRNVEPVKFKDAKIHIAYSGSFSKIKGGVYNAIETARYLSEDYVMHILGFGEKCDEEEVKSMIERVNQNSKCKVIFEGKKPKSDYDSFMKGCTLGLNPQIWGDYMLYAYPSKLLVYLSLGLNVVTSPLKTLKVSSVNPYFNYFEEESPQSIARAIIDTKIYSEEELTSVIEKLNEDFVKDLIRLISKK